MWLLGRSLVAQLIECLVKAQNGLHPRGCMWLLWLYADCFNLNAETLACYVVFDVLPWQVLNQSRHPTVVKWRRVLKSPHVRHLPFEVMLADQMGRFSQKNHSTFHLMECLVQKQHWLYSRGCLCFMSLFRPVWSYKILYKMLLGQKYHKDQVQAELLHEKYQWAIVSYTLITWMACPLKKGTCSLKIMVCHAL